MKQVISRSWCRYCSFFVLLVLLFCFAQVANAYVLLDPTFGNGGLVVTDIAGYFDDVDSIAVDDQNRIVAAGTTRNGTNYDFALFREAGALLKFVEEYKGEFVLLSSSDCVPAVLASRFKTIRKSPKIIENVSSAPYQERNLEGGVQYWRVVKESPLFYPVVESIRGLPAKEKILRLFCSDK